jgi:hypothetical protein
MSTLEKAHPVEQTKAPDGSHKFHLELSITDTQIRNAEYAVGAVGAVALAIRVLKNYIHGLLDKHINVTPDTN